MPPIELRIVKDSEGASGPDPSPLLHIAPQKHPAGSLSFEYDFESPATYVGILTFGDRPKYRSRFVFSVGMTSYSRYVLPATVVLVGALSIALCLRFRKRRRLSAEP